jgi:diaminohydroxyphosphoribosylaminopyrimidine deaminase/5-amino-6-(5-phosphoribosylamino)uracil reductase
VSPGERPGDAAFMRLALREAARARGDTAPNPMVGGVVVRGGRVIAVGHHVRPGRAHGEAVALERAGSRARAATLYVNLEPCAHYGRTPPCVDAVLASGVRRVVVALRDPDPRTAGRSFARLRRAGIEVVVGVEADAARELNRGYLSRVERGRPWTTLKLAATLDGRIATASGESRWITGPAARAWVHRLRRASDAIAVGSGTVLADDPALTARRGERIVHRPRRIVIDSRLQTRPRARLLDPADPGGAWILTGPRAPARRRAALEAAGALVLPVRTGASGLDLRAAWRLLASRGVNDLLVEGGGGLAAALLGAGLVDRVALVLAPRLLGADARPAIGPLGIRRLAGAVALRSLEVRRLGSDVLIVGEC